MRAEDLYGVIAEGFGLEIDNSLDRVAVTDRIMALERYISRGGIVAHLKDVAKLMIDIMSSFSIVCQEAHGLTGAYGKDVVSLAELYKRIQKNFDDVFRKINEALRLPQPGLDLDATAVFIRYLDAARTCLPPKNFERTIFGKVALGRATEIGYDHEAIKNHAGEQYVALSQSDRLFRALLAHDINDSDLIRSLKQSKHVVNMIIHFTRNQQNFNYDKSYIKKNLNPPLENILKSQSTDKNVGACLLQRSNGGDSLLEKINAYTFILSLALKAVIVKEEVVAYNPVGASKKLIVEPAEQLFFKTRTTLDALIKRHNAMYARTPSPPRVPKLEKLGFWRKWSALSTEKKWMFGALVLTEAVAIAVLALFVPGSALITIPALAWATTNVLAAMAGGISAIALDCYLIARSKPTTTGLYKPAKSQSDLTGYDNTAYHQSL